MMWPHYTYSNESFQRRNHDALAWTDLPPLQQGAAAALSGLQDELSGFFFPVFRNKKENSRIVFVQIQIKTTSPSCYVPLFNVFGRLELEAGAGMV
jgi:hypothetical protein